MTEAELKQLVEKISEQAFQRPFKHQVKINHRMTTTGGRYYLNDHHLEINGHFLAPQYRNELIGIIKHELVHYHLHLAHQGYRHRDSDFKLLLNRVQGSRYAPDIGLRRKPKRKYTYVCQNCKVTFKRVRRIDVSRFACGRCGGMLRLINDQK